MAKPNAKLAAYLAANRPQIKAPEVKASEAPAPHAMEPRNPACGCSYCTGNALIVPQSHKPRASKSSNAAPVAIFAPNPGTQVAIEVAYAVKGFRSAAITEPHTGPEILPESLMIEGWSMPSPDTIQ